MVIQFINQQEMDKMNKRRKNMRVAKMLGKRITAFVMAALMVLSLSGITGMTVKAAEKDNTIRCSCRIQRKSSVLHGLLTKPNGVLPVEKIR